ncbi:Sulfhydrogenase 1 subunit gamma [Candidatus Gugararchaeum adminiculabundum]|nr:Sulfhydrogenase 1 subunit gamma [Candidatus Gugararchaeum adminiculabundum]
MEQKPAQKEIRVFQMVEQKQENLDVRSINFEPADGKPMFQFKPGQFAQLSRTLEGGAKEVRFYSLASSPYNAKGFTLIYKLKGSFTNFMNAMKKGDKVEVMGPMGHLAFDEGIHRKVVLFAGGVGIATMISIVRYIIGRKLNVPIILFYSSRTLDEIALKNELDGIAKKNRNFKVIYTVTREDPEKLKGWKGIYSRRVDGQMLRENIAKPDEWSYFVSGRTQMAVDMANAIKVLGVGQDKIKVEGYG